jgi:hypothetical protein
MPLRRTTIAITAGLLGGVGLLGVAAPVASSLSGSPTPSPIALQTASSDDSPGDVSGPCDEAEHAGEPRCADVVVTDTPGAVPPATPAPPPVAPDTGSSTRSVEAAGAGSVTYQVTGGSLTITGVAPFAGWSSEIELATGREVEVDFRSGARRVQVNIELEDGSPRERVRRSDTRGTDAPAENDRPGGSGDDGPTDDSNHRSGDDDSDHRSGRGRSDDHSGHDANDDSSGS